LALLPVLAPQDVVELGELFDDLGLRWFRPDGLLFDQVEYGGDGVADEFDLVVEPVATMAEVILEALEQIAREVGEVNLGIAVFDDVGHLLLHDAPVMTGGDDEMTLIEPVSGPAQGVKKLLSVAMEEALWRVLRAVEGAFDLIEERVEDRTDLDAAPDHLRVTYLSRVFRFSRFAISVGLWAFHHSGFSSGVA
jgi:hypothetical protein